MAGNLWGADVAQLRSLAQHFGKTSETLLQQSSVLTSTINNNTSWKGTDSARFKSDWNGTHRALIQQTARALKEESKRLMTHADEQEKASNAAPGSGGGPGSYTSGNVGGQGRAGNNSPWGPDWISNSDSPFRGGWDAYNGVLGLKTVPLGLRDISQFAARYGDDVAELWRSGNKLDALSAVMRGDLWESAARADGMRGFFSGTSDLLSGKFGDFAQMARGADGAPISGLSKFGLNSAGHVLGGVGVALDGLDTVNAIREGDTGDAMKSGLKTALGVGAFMPPPVGVTCMVIGGTWAAVELVPGAKDAIDGAFDAVGDFTESAVEDIGDGVKDFFGF
ncbi:WXG100 family type VII secretion target [Arthrobacter sp. Soil763]|uniref:WXG100 family type VII secretion target n=1 Tax=Arthrobacter sp. Soil763 TaxID=1736402 RepID=UPI000A7825BB|nr:WXG100 family type VII secretion target [Arthrobacter sp. Soil763]